MIPLILELREHLGGEGRAIAPDSVLSYYSFTDFLLFKEGGKKKGRNCNKGYPCGSSCISRSKNCKNPLQGQAKDANEWLKMQAEKQGGSEPLPQSSEPEAPEDQPQVEEPAQQAETQATTANDREPTLEAQQFNPYADPDLTPDEFLGFLEERAFIRQQDDPTQAFNQSYEDWKESTEDFDTRKSAYKRRVQEAVSQGGMVPSEAAIADAGLSKRDLKQVEENKASVAERRTRVDEIQRAIDHPLMTDEEAEGYKPRMSKEEAVEYLGDSYMAGVDFYHGNSKGVTQSVQNDGVKPEMNTSGLYGQGFYMGSAKEIGEDYASASAFTDGSEVELMTMRAKVKNPMVANTTDLDAISEAFLEFEESDSKEALTEYIKAKGYDSIYLPDAGYMVALDGRQAVVYDSQEMAGGDDNIKAIKDRQSGDNGSISDYVGYVGQTPHGQLLNELERNR